MAKKALLKKPTAKVKPEVAALHEIAAAIDGLADTIMTCFGKAEAQPAEEQQGEQTEGEQE
jgi:hypothetical protein